MGQFLIEVKKYQIRSLNIYEKKYCGGDLGESSWPRAQTSRGFKVMNGNISSRPYYFRASPFGQSRPGFAPSRVWVRRFEPIL
jgi:hypothetical protein